MIEAVAFKRFKQFRDKKITLAPAGLTLLAGGNNAGKSSLLHGLAVWEFCRTVVVMEKGDAAVRIGSRHQGLGLGDDEFSPIAVPSLKHLWTNLKTQRTSADADGYTLRIRCDWSDAGDARHLEFGLSMANDRLFIRATDTNLIAGMKIPRIAYLPPFAGITAREVKVTQAIRTRRIGEGLAGAVLRNILLELNQGNLAERTRLREGRSKIADADLRNLRATDPWEILQSALREHFSAELIMQQFREEYHSYIRVEVDKGVVDRFNLKRHPQYNTRDLMVEGSGFLQWLSVFALATAPCSSIAACYVSGGHRGAHRQADPGCHPLCRDSSQCVAGEDSGDSTEWVRSVSISRAPEGGTPGRPRLGVCSDNRQD
jgi:hypothetical protein